MHGPDQSVTDLDERLHKVMLSCTITSEYKNIIETYYVIQLVTK